MDGAADKAERPQNPRSNANIFEILTFSWMLNLFKTGKKRDLDENDLYTTLKSHKSSWLGNELEKKWKSELAIAYKCNRKPSLLRALIRMFGAKYMMYGFLFCIDEIILKMSQPLLIGGLLSYFNPDSPNKTDIIYAYIYASGLVCNTLFSIFLYVSTQIENLQCGMKIRVACSSIIFRKALRLSHKALGETTEGHIINLLSNDVNRFDLALSNFHYLWIGPLQTIIVTYFLWQEIGYSALIGVSTYFFFIPLQVWMGKRISEIRQVTACRTDERLHLMNELISGIQVIKMYAWEIPFARLIEYARKLEIDQIRGASYIRIVLMSIRPIQIRLQLFISILSYVLLGNDITIQKVFVVSSFYNLMGRTMGYIRSMDYLAEVLVSIKRLQNFLVLEEIDGQNSNTSKSVISDTIIINRKNGTRKNDIDTKNKNESLNSNSLVILNASAKWISNQTVNTLDNINLNVKSGSLVAIIGPVGAGKSSLIQAVLRELPLHEGTIFVPGVVSYASQEPWLFGSSIQQNILFNSPMDEKRYEQVVKSCALLSDFEKFPDGDKTLVGERGINLSGGQRTRINLARAVYKQADIYLLDDPLSAVDNHVGKHIFEKCIRDFLKEKTCIFTTHQIQYLPNADKIVLMENAIILAEGSYQELQASVFDFAKLLGSAEKAETEIHIKEINTNNKEKCPISFTQDKNVNNLLSADESKLNSKKDEEIRSSGNLLKSVYVSYFSAGGSICKLTLFFIMFIFTQVLITGGDYWISFWIKQEEDVLRNEYIVITENYNSTFHYPYITLMTSSNVRQTCVLVYIGLIISLIVIWMIRNVITVSVCMGASINLHNRMFNAIIRATMLHLKTNSSGRISNRFSKDMGAIDDILPKILLSYFQIIMLVVGIIFVVGLVNIYLMIPTLIIGLIFYNIRMYYLATSRSIKRLEGVTKSPLLAHLNESMHGVSTIRSYGAEDALSKEFDTHQDLHSSAWYLFISANEAFGLWLDIVCLIYISIVTFSFVYFDTNAYQGNIGLAITQIITLSGMVQWGIRQSTELENQMISVERVLEYTNTPQEADFQSVPDKKPPTQWPDRGEIIFDNLSLRYSQDTPYVLKNLNFRIHSMEKVGIVGRTGAGKSSLIAALFRLAFNEGNIFIDDREIHELGLHDLRSKIAIIPQKPVLFSGTIRTNLDPFDEYADHVLWNALDKVEFKEVVEELHDGLNTKMLEGGSNFSAGQRQLLCLARAIVRNNKIIILDEATANVDPQTDALIQNTIRNKFRTCTVLTIAHRLNTIMDSDRVMVMDAGNVIEFDHPFDLLKNKNGYFYKMVELTGKNNADVIHILAMENFYTVKTTMEPLTNKFVTQAI